MYVYAALMYALALIFIWMGRRIFRGDVGLIHAYHQTRVKDSAAYGRDFGWVMCGLGAVMLLSGTLALFGEKEEFMLAAVAVLLVGMAACIVLLLRVQKKHNGGLF